MLCVIQSFTKEWARNAIDIKKWKTVFNARVQEGFVEEMAPQRTAKNRWVRRTF